jgi:hypothetical protein
MPSAPPWPADARRADGGETTPPQRRFAHRDDRDGAGADALAERLAELGPPAPGRLVELTAQVLGADACAIREAGRPHDAPTRVGERDWPAGAHTPLLVGGRMHGALAVGSADPERLFDGRDLELLGVMAELVAGTLVATPGRWPSRAAQGQLRALEATLAEPGGDERLRASLAVALAEPVARSLLPGDARGQAEIVLAARLHDVGMLRVPRARLRRPGRLPATDTRLVEGHAAWGCDILAGVPGLATVAAIVLFHQERVDGRGYPHGLAGGRVPLASLAVGAIAAWAAIVAGGPHVAARSPEDALAELRRHAGTQFDPRVVEAVADASPMVATLRVPA